MRIRSLVCFAVVAIALMSAPLAFAAESISNRSAPPPTCHAKCNTSGTCYECAGPCCGVVCCGTKQICSDAALGLCLACPAPNVICGDSRCCSPGQLCDLTNPGCDSNCTFPISSLSSCPAADLRQHRAATSNGCGPDGVALAHLIPQSWFGAKISYACDEHDACYGSCGAAYNKAACDKQLLNNLDAICVQAFPSEGAGRTSCFSVAADFYNSVKNGGQKAYNNAQLADCMCCP
jgi:hypothetical protein